MIIILWSTQPKRKLQNRNNSRNHSRFNRIYQHLIEHSSRRFVGGTRFSSLKLRFHLISFDDLNKCKAGKRTKMTRVTVIRTSQAAAEAKQTLDRYTVRDLISALRLIYVPQPLYSAWVHPKAEDLECTENIIRARLELKLKTYFHPEINR